MVDGKSNPNTSVGLGACAVLVVLGMPAYLVLRRCDRDPGHARLADGAPPQRITNLLKTPQMWRSLTVSGVVLVSLDLMYAFVPVWAIERDISATAVGVLLALRAAVTA
jgi:hypothetical protein